MFVASSHNTMRNVRPIPAKVVVAVPPVVTSGILCPCCNQSIPEAHAPLSSLDEISMMGGERRLLKVLREVYPRAVSIEFLVSELYSYDSKGGPNGPENVVRQYMWRLRQRLRAFGWTIPSNRGGTGHHGRYRLAPLPRRTPQGSTGERA